MVDDRAAQIVYDKASRTLEGQLNEYSTKFVCPYPDCQTLSVQHWGVVKELRRFAPGFSTTRAYRKSPLLEVAECEACGRESVFLNGMLTFPKESQAPAPTNDLPAALLEDYEEARSIYLASPRGAAALLRLVIQKLLPFLGATISDINKGIGELVQAGKIKTQIQQALDTVRVIGNESVHPGEMDLKDDQDTALALFRIVNLIVETEITEPKRLEELYKSLPKNKLDGIKARDKASN